MSDSVERIVSVLSAIPPGSVLSYGEVASAAGVPRGARLVVRVLNAKSGRLDLPWHRVVRAGGIIALRPGSGFELQKALLEAEGWNVSADGRLIGKPGAGG